MGEFDLRPEEIAARLTETERLDRVGLPAGFSPRQANAITQARLQFSLSELADRNVENIHKWISQVAEKDPVTAVRLFLELLEFRMPKLKAAQVVANLTPNAAGQKRLAELSMEELERVIAEG